MLLRTIYKIGSRAVGRLLLDNECKPERRDSSVVPSPRESGV
jgi:hypothetical protein